MTADDEVPAIRTFQMDSLGTGTVRNNVNLFRGDVNLTQPLFSMPGLTEGSALGVDVSLSYQSNVLHAATIWNREEPTSIVGLGWELPTSYLERVDNGSATPESWSYRYWMNGASSALVPDPQMTNATLFWIAAADLQKLRADRSPTLVRDAGVLPSRFSEHGVALNASARVVASLAESAWIIEDDRAQRSFKLLPQDGGYAVLDGGQAFQLASFQFWQIRYYAEYASWTVLTESGGILTFGGNDAAGTIEWSVGWAAASGGLLWRGPSTLLPGQMRYQRAWRLASNGDVFGNQVTYVYDQVMQAVGVGGLTYTKACYLSSITDVFGRVATFSYAEKLFDATDDAQPREYADPHNPKADGSPNAFQDRYETRFLDGIDVRAATGELLFGVDLGYAVTNVTTFTGRLKGDTFKRYLASISLRGSDGTRAPGMKFGYCDATSSPGAIATVEYPTGAMVTYAYVLHDLDICDRTLSIASPDPSKSFIPGVWYGSDFAVTTWCQPTVGTLMMSVYTWIGRWQKWQLDPNDATLFQSPGGIDRETLNVTVSDDQFVLSFAHATGSAAFVFRRSNAMPAVWQPAALPSGTTAKNLPTLTYSTGDGRISFFAGSAYVVATAQTGALTTYDRMTWRWNERAWTLEHLAIANPVTVASGPTYYALIDNTTCALTLYSLGQTLQWTASSVTQLGSGPVEPANIALDVGNCCIAVCILLSGGPQFNHYQVTLLRWDASYTITSLQTPFQDGLNGAAVGWQPTVVDDDTVGVAAHLFRFNGRDWLQNNTLYVAQPQTGQAQRYAYGKDFTAQVLVRGTTSAYANVLAFDANVSSAAWSSTPASVTCALPVAPDPVAGNWPWAAYDVLTIGSMAWSRGDSTDWAAIVVQSPTDLLSFAPVAPGATIYADSRTLVNQGPAFVAFCAISGSRSAANLGVGVSIRNGVMQALQTPFENEAVSVPPFRGNAGFQPGGPNAFTAFSNTAQSFELATCIILHRFAGYALAGNITHYAVCGATVDDGFGQVTPTTYDYDKAAATCDPDGAVIKYSVATMYPGTPDPARTPFGKVVTTFLNGLAQGSSSALDGLVASERTYDANANLVKSTQNAWAVMTEAAADPMMPTAAPRLLFGSYVVLLKASSTMDAVPDDRMMVYMRDGQLAPFSNQPVSTLKSLQNENGTTERFATDIRYACEVYAQAKAANFLTAPALTVTTWTAETAATITISAAATTYRNFAPADSPVALAPESDWKWVGGAAAEFPFGTCKHGDTVPGWNEIHGVLQRNAAGMVVTAVDAAGVTESVLYGDASLAVATFVAASIADAACAYCGFESYESGGGFIADGTSIVAGDSWSGTSSLSLAGAGASLSTTVSDTKGAAYVCGFALKTQAGYQPGANAQWTAELTAADGTKTSQSFPFTATGGVWKYITFPVLAGGGPGTITLRAVNSGTDPVLLDNVALLPLAATLVVRSFDPVQRRLTSTMDITGCTTRHFYDCFGRNTVTSGAGDATKEILQRFMSRLAGGTEGFVAASPNLDLTLHPAGLGYTESFATGQEWVARWTPSAPADWTCVDGRLIHQTGAAGRLTWASPGANAGTPVAIYFSIAAAAALTAPFGIAFGGGYTVQYIPHAGYVLADLNGVALGSPLSNPDHLVSEWLLIVGPDAALFFGDGQMIFSARLSCDLAASIGIYGPPDAFTLGALTYASNPRVGIVYKDAAGRQRQLHQLCFGANARPSEAHVLEVLYDGMDRKTAVTRIAPSGFGKDAALPLLAYRPNFVDGLSFLAGMASTWRMQGDVADYFRGQPDGASRRTDDEGYCYFGTRFEPSILGRIVEAGLPGKALAIHDIDTTTPLQRATMQYGFGAAPTAGTSGGLLQRKTTITPVKRTVSVDYDAAGHPLRSTETSAAGVDALTGIAAATYATDSSQVTTGLVTMQLPNAVMAGPQSDMSAFTVIVEQGPRGSVARRQEASTGVTAYIYDSASRLRFVQPALDAGDLGFVYFRYDGRGRRTEEGQVAIPWEPVTLQALAENPAWPDESVAHSVSRLRTFDGDGSDANSLGHCVRVVTDTAAPAGKSVTETFAYDRSGRVIAVELAVEGVRASHRVEYTYNNLNECESITYPAGAPVTTVWYGYDDLGRVTSISSTEQHTGDLACYTYSPDGSVETEIRGGGILAGTFEFDGGGRMLGHKILRSADSAPVFELGYTYEADDVVATRNVAIEGIADAAWRFTYDDERRLASATVPGAVGNESIGSFDPNGNIWAATLDGVLCATPCVAGSDRISTVTAGDAAAQPIAYAADGWVTSARAMTFTHDRVLGRTTQVTTNGASPATLQLAFGAGGERVLKEVTGTVTSSIVTIYGDGVQPLARLVDGYWIAYVHGPVGLVAIADEQQRYYPLCDPSRTLWGACDTIGKVVQTYAYSPFGTLLSQKDEAPACLSPSFLGGEWDGETGLFDFRARLYDPGLRRFLAPDSAGQFASPYLAFSNNPLSFVDPSGNLSLWARIGIGIGLVAIMVVGIAAAPETGGASVAGADVALGGAEAASGVELAGMGAGEAGGGAGAAEAGGGVGEAAGEGGGQAAARGAGEAAQASAKSVLGTLGRQMLSGALTGGASSGLGYDVEHGSDFSWRSFSIAVGVGAAAGAVTEGVAGRGQVSAYASRPGPYLAEGAAAPSGRVIAARIGGAALKGAFNNGVSQMLVNRIEDERWDHNLWQQVLTGALAGAASGSLKNSGAIALNTGRVHPEGFVRTQVLSQIVKNAALSTTGKLAIGTGTGVLLGAWLGWGAGTGWGRG